MENFIYAFPFCFIGMWIFVVFVISRLGWSSLASKYKLNQEFSGKSLGIISANINTISYNNCLFLEYNEEGIMLKPFVLFKLFHPALLIPWEEIKDVRDESILFFKCKELVIGEPRFATITLRRKTYDKISGQYELYKSVKRK